MDLSLSDIQDKFRERGLKRTPQRAAIYQALSQSTAHPTAEELYAIVSPHYPMLSLNTVYYTLTTLQKAGLIQEVNVGHNRARFDANLSPHHHLICLGCQSIVDVMDDRLNHLTPPSGLPKGFSITDHQVAFRGYCGHCRQSGSTTFHSGVSPITQGGRHGQKSQRDKKSRQPQGRIRR
ncbi:MAG: transcriptional repressor [Nitrospira sp.]|nr:transcriptional repressor [Nitrospira sp.]MCA9465285.1 transcriptional repressor [Nitrospira sp.]MCA9477117.1 transcriptional repressor [Nitrospira sp.]MDR4489037.1 transcriptional repressor [Nitrospirales bacterium]HQU29153.1 transcriptional repressor [Nitrospirales bacterium]